MKQLNGKATRTMIRSSINYDNSLPYAVKRTLAIVTIGEDEASKVYVNNKKKECVACKFGFMHIHLDSNTSFPMLSKLVKSLNNNSLINGIIIQKPLPKQLQRYESTLDKMIKPSKDVDGFNPVSDFEACTPKGIITLLEEYDIPLNGMTVVIAGRSDIVAKPLADMLLRKNCTVTMIHTSTPIAMVEVLLDNCDIFISAIGKPHHWTSDLFSSRKDRVALIDVGINRTSEGLVGDIHPSCYEYFEYYTPVPGGVGQMTVASLMQNLSMTEVKEE